MPVLLGRCTCLSQSFYLWLPSGFLLEWRFCPALGMRRYGCNTLAVLPVDRAQIFAGLRANPLGGEGYKRQAII